MSDEKESTPIFQNKKPLFGFFVFLASSAAMIGLSFIVLAAVAYLLGQNI